MESKGYMKKVKKCDDRKSKRATLYCARIGMVMDTIQNYKNKKISFLIQILYWICDLWRCPLPSLHEDRPIARQIRPGLHHKPNPTQRY